MINHKKLDSVGFAHIIIPLAAVLILLIGGLGVYVFKTNTRTSALHKTKDLKFITSSPVDLAQINNFSKFRSCSGHDYSGTNVDNIKEAMRSMKHYASPDNSLLETNNKIKVFAPFDGTVSSIGKSKGRGVGLSLKPSVASGWTFEFGHVQPLNTIAKGMTIKSGDLLGYADVTQGAGGFDLQLYYPKLIPRGFDGLDSFMNHANQNVINTFADYGFSKDAMIIDKVDRDNSPCRTSNKQDNGDAVFISDLESDIVTTNQPLTNQTTKPETTKSGTPDKSSNASGSAASEPEECATTVPADQRPPGCN